MNIKELKAAIADLPDNMDVMIEQTNDESRYGLANEAEVENVVFGDEDIPKEEWANEDCLVIRDI